jgi:signal transduction histidine kinase
MTPYGGRLLIRVRKSRSWIHPHTPGIRVSVADTGSGMTREVQQRIFEPFFTTKEVTGTGLGLWVSAGIIKKHGGAVRVRSRVPAKGSAGTVFMIFFPADGVSVAEAQENIVEESVGPGPASHL